MGRELSKVTRVASIAAITLALTIGIASCSSAGSSRATTSPSAATKLGEVSDIDDLRDAFQAAGGACDSWEQTNQVTNARESGSCSTATVLMVFDSVSKRDDTVSSLQSFVPAGEEQVLLVGQNWVINSKESRDVVAALGGSIRVAKGEAKPSPTPKPAAVVRQEFSGTGDFVQDVGMLTTIAAVTFRCDDCSRNTVLKSNGDESLIVNTIGSYSGSHIINVYDDSATSRFEIEATGSWTLVIDDISTLPRFDGAATGTGDAAILMLGKFDTAQITNDGERNFQVFAYGGTGSPLVVNDIGAYSGVKVLEGPTIIQVISTGAWSISPM